MSRASHRVLLFVAIAAATPAWANEPPRMAAMRAEVAPKLDGRLDDAVWQLAAASDAFVQKFPDEGRRPVEPTTVRVLHDRDAIWIGVDCEQRTAPITARLTRRDRAIEADAVTIDLDSKESGTSAFEFSVNAAGVLSDGIRYNDTDYSGDWDENWDARVARTDHGWSAEFRIPLRILRFDAQPVQSWGLQVRRTISARQETDEWAYIPRTDAGEVSRYGKLIGLRGLRPGGAFELRPFVTARLRHRDASAELLGQGWDVSGSAGGELKWHLTQNLTLDLSFNPDFGQVEADQVVLNLSTYEVFYPEKRPFFIEGVDLFATPIGVLYTRRIGRAPETPALRDGERLVDAPLPSTILGAAKLTGTIGRKLSVALLAALTARNAVAGETADGTHFHRIADPMTLYTVARLRGAVGRNFDVGVIATTTTRFEPIGLYPLVAARGADPTHALCPDGTPVGVGERCFHDAYVAGTDLRWRSPNGDYVVQAQAIASGIVGGPARPMPDGTFIGAGDWGMGWAVQAAKQGGKHWLWDLAYDGASTKLDYNDLGYMSRQNLHHVDATLEYRTTEPWGKTLETHWRAEFFDRETLRGLNLARGYQLNTNGKLTNFWGWFAELHYRARHFDDREVGDGTALEREALVGVELGLNSDTRRRVYFELFTQTQAIWNGFNFYADGKLTVRVLPQLDFDVLPTATYTFGEPRYAGEGAAPGERLFGRLTAGAIGATLRATYTFLPRLSLQVYAQLFLAFKSYGDFTSFSAPGQLGPVVHLADLRPTRATPLVNPDVEETVLNLNVVLRWEYRLGSTLYFVYTRAQAPEIALTPGQPGRFDPGALHRGGATDTLLLKLTYWWG